MRLTFSLLAFTLAAAPTPARAQAPDSLTSTAFAALSARLSEPSGFFDTDNLVSNEDSYLHAITGFQKYGVEPYRAYLGVGPDQNFSYIASLQPRIAFILDIRRDNLLEHLMFKALFAHAADRIAFLCLLFGKALPADTTGWSSRDLAALLDYVTRASPDLPVARAVLSAGLKQLGFPLSPKDLETIARFHAIFTTEGPGLRLTTFGRPDRLDYPDYRRLLLERDLNGKPANYLATESDFRFVKSLEGRNLVVPVVGDFAGPHALAAIGDYLAAHGLKVSAFYTSNVEQYLFRGTSFEAFRKNVGHLPHDATSVMVRSYFPYQRGHAQQIPGYISVQLLQTIDTFLATPYTYYD